MFIGHFAAGLAAKKFDERPSLGTMFIATQFIDLLWPFLLLFGIERVKIDPGNTAFTPLDFIYYPFSHGFVSVFIWALLFAGVYYALKKNRKGALVLGGLVMSHWILDFLTHRPDLPILWSGFKVGLGMWNSVIFTLIFEGALFTGGAYLYMKSTKAENRIGSIGLKSLLVFLVIVYMMNVFGPPPESVEAIPYVGFSMWILVAWAYWVDKNRKPVK